MREVDRPLRVADCGVPGHSVEGRGGARVARVLTGREYFYEAWCELVRDTIVAAPVLDLGTPEPFRKEMSVLRGHSPTPYICLDIRPAAGVAVIGDGHSLPFADDSVGSIVCSHVLEHVAHPNVVIAEMHRVLRGGGRAYMTFLDMHPYHASPGVYPDYHRFKRDAIDLLLKEWSAFEVLQGGGLGHVAVGFVPAHLVRFGVWIANWIDRVRLTTATDVFYVSAVR